MPDLSSAEDLSLPALNTISRHEAFFRHGCVRIALRLNLKSSARRTNENQTSRRADSCYPDVIENLSIESHDTVSEMWRGAYGTRA